MNPLAVGNSQGKQQLRLNWPDGREQRLGHAELRRQCPCSQCRAFRLQGLTVKVDPRIRVVELNAKGYGLQLISATVTNAVSTRGLTWHNSPNPSHNLVRPPRMLQVQLWPAHRGFP